MTKNDIFMALYAVCIVGMALLFVIGNVIIDRFKQARADRAKERAREADLYARYQAMRETVERSAGMQ
jgi:hypothetical protein